MSAPATPPGQGLRVLVVVPTTGGPLLLRRLAPRPGLPHPAAFAEGDYRPLALSADYRALAGPEGPVSRHLGAALPPHELRLSGEPDGGRSWEAPVTLAHLLLAGGASLAAEGEGADLLLWATGAVDLDLRLLPGDYALPLKVEASRALLEAPGALRAVAVLPPGPGRAEAIAALAALRRARPVEVVTADAIGDALARLSDAGVQAAAPRGRSFARGWVAAALALLAAWLPTAVANGPEAAALATLAALQDPAQDPPDPEAPAGDDQPAQPPPTEPAKPAASEAQAPAPTTSEAQTPEAQTPVAPTLEAQTPEAASPETTVPETASAEVPAVEASPPLPDPATDAPTPPALIDEVRAAPGATCRAALFDPRLRVLRPVARDGAGYAALSLDPLLCGVALRPAAAGAALGAVASDPPDALVAAPSADGARVLFLSGPPRDVVYAVPVTAGDGTPAAVEHRLVAPSPTDAPTE